MELTTRCSQMGLRVLQVPFTWGIVSPRLDLAELGQLQLINISRLSYTSFAQAWKRGVDLVAVIVGGLILSPLLLLTTLLVGEGAGAAAGDAIAIFCAAGAVGTVAARVAAATITGGGVKPSAGNVPPSSDFKADSVARNCPAFGADNASASPFQRSSCRREARVPISV